MPASPFHKQSGWAGIFHLKGNGVHLPSKLPHRLTYGK